MTVKEAYVWCRDDMKFKDPQNWEDWCPQVGVEVPQYILDKEDETEEEKAELGEEYEPRYAYVAKRNQRKKAVNEFARKEKQNWRICSYTHGRSIVKYQNGDLVELDVPVRYKRIAQHMEKARDEFEALYDAIEDEAIEKEDRQLLKSSKDLLLGAMMTIRGSIQALKLIPPNIKKSLLDFFDIEREN